MPLLASPVLALLVYVLVGVAVAGLGVLLYVRSLASRQAYRCPQCREVVSVELMRASRCNVCGAPLHYPDRYSPDREGDDGPVP